MKRKIKDIAERAIKTFIQGFLGSLAVLLPNSDYSDLSVLKSVIIGALAGGLSALMNLLFDDEHEIQQVYIDRYNQFPKSTLSQFKFGRFDYRNWYDTNKQQIHNFMQQAVGKTAEHDLDDTII